MIAVLIAVQMVWAFRTKTYHFGAVLVVQAATLIARCFFSVTHVFNLTPQLAAIYAGFSLWYSGATATPQW